MGSDAVLAEVVQTRLTQAFRAAVLLVVFGLAASAQQRVTTPAASEWQTYNHDLAGTRFSPLTEINTSNVSTLAKTWTYQFPAPPGGGRGGGLGAASEAVPIVVGGVMYLPVGNTVVALEADTGKVIWQREVAGGPQAGAVSRRGVGYFAGDRNTPDRIIVTAGRRLLAFDAATGKPSEGFGTNGEVDMVVGYAGTPTIYKNVIMVGASVNELPQGPPGNTRAFDAVTGRKLWEFHTVPRPGEVGHETWLDNGWENRSGTNTWGFSETIDEARGIAYLPIAGPAANYWGGDRPGNNLFGNSVVAVDIVTGKYKWHFQTVHHDIWDIDMSAAPGLVDIKQGGRTIPALATVGKGGYMFILDRTNGKPVFGVEERPVPKGNVPGEWYSPTQPFPAEAAAAGEVRFKKEDMVTAADTTPEHVRACQELWDKSGGFTNEGPFTPFTFHEDGAPPKSTISFPGGTGGVNWGGTATDPRTGLHLRELARHVARGLGGEEEARRDVQLRYGRLAAHLRSRERGRCRAVPHVLRAGGQGRQRPRRHPSVPASAMVPVDRGQREHRRHCVGDDARRQRLPAGGEAERRRQRQRWPDGDGRRPGVRRRDGRPPLPRVRLEDRQRVVGHEARQGRQRQPDDLSGEERQAVCGDRRDRHAGRLRPAVVRRPRR